MKLSGTVATKDKSTKHEMNSEENTQKIAILNEGEVCDAKFNSDLDGLAAVLVEYGSEHGPLGPRGRISIGDVVTEINGAPLCWTGYTETRRMLSNQCKPRSLKFLSSDQYYKKMYSSFFFCA